MDISALQHENSAASLGMKKRQKVHWGYHFFAFSKPLYRNFLARHEGKMGKEIKHVGLYYVAELGYALMPIIELNG
ncbi:hypothetical protein IFM89_012520 [Coptis chinensis]|uniref:Uncharacterized protein n=1 Tax=Coptis chinensis TaxID=261450 RepID=A0A835HJG5_9MAGN|nr:hypothetical protein IFM89_012520 [Coptis chinensis]